MSFGKLKKEKKAPHEESEIHKCKWNN